ncbi:MAG: MOSC domain-containing protein [Kofleriaceae bacterium]
MSAHRTASELDSGLDTIRASPRDAGTIALITRRPHPGSREILDEAQLDTTLGLIGDGWYVRPNKKTPDGLANPLAQLTLMNVRAIRAIADEVDWVMAGDQLYVDLDLSGDNLPAGTRLAAGAAILEVTAHPHTGCAKFTERFGSEAMRWVNSDLGRSLNLRGINTRVIEPGVVRRGEPICKL